MVAERRSDAIVTSRLGAQQLDGAPSAEPALSLSKGSGGLRPIPASHILSLAQYEGWPGGAAHPQGPPQSSRPFGSLFRSSRTVNHGAQGLQSDPWDSAFGPLA